MEAFFYGLSGLTAALAALNIVQYFFIKAQKKKIYAQADQEVNTADSGKFDNLKKEIDYLRELRDQDRKEMQQLREEAITNANRVIIVGKENQQMKYYQEKHERQLVGIQKSLNKEIGRKQYAERHICLNVDCQTRKPNLGEFHTEDPVFQSESEQSL